MSDNSSNGCGSPWPETRAWWCPLHGPQKDGRCDHVGPPWHESDDGPDFGTRCALACIELIERGSEARVCAEQLEAWLNIKVESEAGLHEAFIILREMIDRWRAGGR